jgi:hypothetical protein
MGIGKIYQRIIILMLLISSALFIRCSTNDDKNNCDETAQPRIEPMFRIHLIAQYENGTPYVGSAKFTVQKQYCNGTISGRFRDSTEAVIDGYWKPITSQYIMENDSDGVTVNFQLVNISNLGKTYYYSEVADYSYVDEFGQIIFEDTIETTIYP